MFVYLHLNVILTIGWNVYWAYDKSKAAIVEPVTSDHHADMQKCHFVSKSSNLLQLNGSAGGCKNSSKLLVPFSFSQPANMAETAESKPSNKRFRKDKRKHRVDPYIDRS